MAGANLAGHQKTKSRQKMFMPNTEATYLERLSISFRAWHRYLEYPHIARRAVVFLLVIHAGLLAYSAFVHSPTLNEPGHLVAGLSHWKFRRFELYRVNPPLVRMVAALPVLAVGYEENWSGFHEHPGARPEFSMGVDFVRANRNRAQFLFVLARWACIPFSIIGAVTCYLWSRDLFGPISGLIACMLWCLSPNILGHGALLTSDIGGTSLGVAACYTFWLWLRKPSWTQTVLTGLLLGLAELGKTTLILFYPLWPILWLSYRFFGHEEMSFLRWKREASMLLVRMVIGMYVLNLGYGFEGSFKQLKDYRFVSELFSGKVYLRAISQTSNEQATLSEQSGNRFTSSLLGNLPLPFPSNYVLGIDLQQKDFEKYGQDSYLNGEFRNQGWWYYYLYALVVKIPLFTWVSVMFLIVICSLRSTEAPRRDLFILLAPAFTIFLVASSKTGFSHHMRYVLPCFPFGFIFASQISSKLASYCVIISQRSQGRFRMPIWMLIPVVALIGSGCSSIYVYPHSLSFFSILVGGPKHGARHLLHSNIDWGQDLLYLCQPHNSAESKPMSIAYYGGVSPTDLGIKQMSQSMNDRLSNLPVSERECSGPLESNGYIAISVNLLHGVDGPIFKWCPDGKLPPKIQLDDYRNRCPVAYAGYSIYVFKQQLFSEIE